MVAAPTRHNGGVPTILLRSLLGRIGTLLVAVSAFYVTAAVWLSDGYGHGVQTCSVAAVVIVAVWLLWWRPQATLSESCLTVRNAWRTHTVPWSCVEAARGRWGLVVATTAGDVPVSAAPRGGLATAMQRERRVIGIRDEYVTPSDAVYRTHLNADDASQLIELYQAVRADHHKAMRRTQHPDADLRATSQANPASLLFSVSTVAAVILTQLFM